MGSKVSLKQFAYGAVLGGLAFGYGVSGAVAAPMTFSWDPAAAVAGADGTFTANNITVADFATINVTSGGAFTENGLIQLSQFIAPGGGNVNLPGLNQNYALYVTFTAAGTQGSGTVLPPPNSSISGVFSSLNFSLIAAAGKPVFTSTAGGATVTGLTGSQTVATGSLITGTSTLANTPLAGLSAGANVLTTFVPTFPAFFVAPPTTFGLDFFTSVVNTGSVLTTSGTSELIINGGGGNATLQSVAVPEPASLALLGAGLLGLTYLRRRQAN